MYRLCAIIVSFSFSALSPVQANHTKGVRNIVKPSGNQGAQSASYCSGLNPLLAEKLEAVQRTVQDLQGRMDAVEEKVNALIEKVVEMDAKSQDQVETTKRMSVSTSLMAPLESAQISELLQNFHLNKAVDTGAPANSTTSIFGLLFSKIGSLFTEYGPGILYKGFVFFGIVLASNPDWARRFWNPFLGVFSRFFESTSHRAKYKNKMPDQYLLDQYLATLT